MYRILVFGDSIAYGSWDTQGGWVERLKADVHKRTVESGNQFKRQVFNLGVGGHTSTDILNRLKTEIEARAVDRWETALVFLYGTNDERYINGLPQVELSDFGKNTQQIITIAKKYTDKILIFGIPPLPMDEVVFKTSVYSDVRVKQYDESLESITKANNITYVNLRDEYDRYGIAKVFNIGKDPHPNDLGHKVIYELARTKLEEMLG